MTETLRHAANFYLTYGWPIAIVATLLVMRVSKKLVRYSCKYGGSNTGFCKAWRFVRDFAPVAFLVIHTAAIFAAM
jgi:hypothetical protein